MQESNIWMRERNQRGAPCLLVAPGVPPQTPRNFFGRSLQRVPEFVKREFCCATIAQEVGDWGQNLQFMTCLVECLVEKTILGGLLLCVQEVPRFSDEAFWREFRSLAQSRRSRSSRGLYRSDVLAAAAFLEAGQIYPVRTSRVAPG